MHANDSATATNKLHGKYAKVEAAATISACGAMQTGIMPEDVDGDRVAAVCAPMLSRGSEMLLETTGADMQQLFIKAHYGCVLLNSPAVGSCATLIARSCDRCGDLAEVQDCINALLSHSVAA